MQIENNLTLLTSILKKGRCILFSSDGVWGLSCNALRPKAVHDLVEKSSNNGKFITEFLVSDLQMLKKFAKNLHPRVETLLVYHQRPVRIKCDAKDSLKEGLNGHEIYFRLVKDKASRILINEVNHPIFKVSFWDETNERHLNRQEIKLSSYENVDFIAGDKDYPFENYPLIKLSFDEEGMIEILK